MSTSSDEDVAIVIDSGSGICKAGFAGDDAPRSVFSTIVGRSRDHVSKTALKECYVGEEAQSKRELLSLRHPIEHGIITNWEDMEAIWQHIFHELHVSSQDNPVLVSEPPLNPRTNREKMAQIFFECFGVPGFYSAVSGILAVYGSGFCSSMMLDIGDTVSHVIQIYEGHCPYQGIRRLDIGGRDITDYLQRLLYKRGYSFTSSYEMELARDMKEKHGYIALDYDKELMESTTSTQFDESYELPDGKTITLGNERFRCAEALFQPSLIGYNIPSVQEMCWDSIMSVEADVRRDFIPNLVISGGSTMFPGFAERLKKELLPKVAPSRKLRTRVVSTIEREYLVWIGGSILASLSLFENWWLTKRDYEEYGPSLVYRKPL